jgi:transposase
MQVAVLGTERRRRWSYEEKVRIVDETTEPGVTVCEVARRHSLAPSVVFTWRRLARQGCLGGRAVTSLPVEITPGPAEAMSATPTALQGRLPRRSGLIEIILNGGRCIRVDRDVDAEALRRVLQVVESLA